MRRKGASQGSGQSNEWRGQPTLRRVLRVWGYLLSRRTEHLVNHSLHSRTFYLR